ncbi:MAG: sialidase family protein [Caldilineaceae bacterium]
MLEHFIIYRNEDSYSAFPDIKRLANGELVVIFREALRRARVTHLDSSSKATLVRSRDGGQTWTAHAPITVAEGGPDIGIQDPSINQLRDGTLISNFFKWQVYRDEPYGAEGLGAFVTTSTDNGYTWNQNHVNVGRPPGIGAWVSTTDAVLELPSGELLIPVYENNSVEGEQGGHRAFLMQSTDKGNHWQPWGLIGYDPFGNHHFEEPTLAYLPSGKLVCILREDKRKEQAWQADSWDGGKTWSTPRRLPVWGHPQHLLRLQSGRLLMTYGYRRPPYGVRACISADEGVTWNLQHELVLRSDGANTDLGYPCSVQLENGQILTVYYFHEPGENGVRFIAGSVYEEW